MFLIINHFYCILDIKKIAVAPAKTNAGVGKMEKALLVLLQ
jgi:hypothetical protein